MVFFMTLCYLTAVCSAADDLCSAALLLLCCYAAAAAVTASQHREPRLFWLLCALLVLSLRLLSAAAVPLCWLCCSAAVWQALSFFLVLVASCELRDVILFIILKQYYHRLSIEIINLYCTWTWCTGILKILRFVL